MKNLPKKRRANTRFLATFRLCSASLCLTLLAGCAADPDLATAPGTCKIDCSGQKIASTDMRIRILTPDINLTCQPNVDAYPNSVPIRFVVEKPRTQLPGETIYDLPSSEDDTTRWTPVSGISFHPLLLSGDGAVPNDIAEDRFNGIQTSSEQWCTDSCGVGSLEVQPRCYNYGTQGDVFRLGLFSGALSGEVSITIQTFLPEK